MTNPTAIQKSNSTSSTCCTPSSTTSDNRQDIHSWSYVPAMDVWEREQEFVFEMDAPGLSAADTEVTFEKGVLHVHGPVASRFDQSTRFLRQEYGVGDFDREIPLGRLNELVDGNNAAADYRDGVLTIRLPKIERARAKKISVKVV